MPRVCLIGDSHLAALKLGWPRIQPQFPGMTLVFYAVPASLLHVEIVGGKLVAPEERIRKRLARTSEGDGDIGPDHDVYVLCGLELALMKALRGFFAKRAAARAAGAVYGNKVGDLALAMEPALRDTIACDVAAKLRQLTKAPLFLIANPLPAYERHAEQWERLKKREHIAEACEIACKKIAADHAAIFIPQPAETVDATGLTTRNTYYLLPPDQVARETTPHTHMNADYGAIILRDALEKIEACLLAQL